MMKIIKKGWIILGALLLIVSYGCSGRNTGGNHSNKEESPPIPVEVTEVIKGSVSANYSGTATLEAEGEAVVVAKVSGIVKEIFVEEGDQVKAGRVLAKLEDEQFVHELAQVEAKLEELANDYQRNKELYQNKLVSVEAYESVKYEYQTQKSIYDLKLLNLNYTEIKAPISGTVSERLIKVGNMVTINQPTFRVTDFDPLLAVLHVPEKELIKLRVGFPAELTADAVPDEKFSASILRISPIISAQTGTFKVTVGVSDKTRKLKPGMFTRVNIVYDMHEDTLLVPKDAILTEDIETAVFVVKEKVEDQSDNKENSELEAQSDADSAPEESAKSLIVSKQNVTTGYINSTHVEILSGVKLGDIVVTTGLSSLKDGAKVKVVEK